MFDENIKWLKTFRDELRESIRTNALYSPNEAIKIMEMILEIQREIDTLEITAMPLDNRR